MSCAKDCVRAVTHHTVPSTTVYLFTEHLSGLGTHKNQSSMPGRRHRRSTTGQVCLRGPIKAGSCWGTAWGFIWKSLTCVSLPTSRLGLGGPGYLLVAHTGPTFEVPSLVGRYRVQPTHLASSSASEVLPISRMERKQKRKKGSI